MEYRKDLYDAVDKFFMEIVIPYGTTTAEGGQLVKKFKPFSKKSYDEFVDKFREYAAMTEAISVEKIRIPQEDTLALELADAFEKCKDTFIKLCTRNADFYDFQNRKAAKEKVTLDELQDITLKVNLAMNSAGRDIDILENAYKEMKADDEPEYAKILQSEKDAIAKAREEQQKAQEQKIAKESEENMRRVAKMRKRNK